MKRRHEEEEAGHERWLVSYADFITLMFAFFAVLYATSQHDVQKSKEFQESLKRFLVKAGGAGGAGEGGQNINISKKEDSPIEQPIPTFTKEKPETVKMLDEAEQLVEGRLTREERQRYVLDLEADQWGVRLTLRSAELFASGSDKFQESALPFISKVGEMLPKLNRSVMIEGHVAGGETGPTRSTWDFSSARAVNVLRFMQAKNSLKPERMSAISFGDSRPSYKGSDNSRIEIVFLNADMEM